MSSVNRNFTNLSLPPCCQTALKEIKDRTQIGKLLQRAVAVGPFVTMFGGFSIPEMLGSLHHTDWDSYGKAVKAVPIIVRRRCADDAALHSLEHPGGDLNRFWVAMHEEFSK